MCFEPENDAGQALLKLYQALTAFRNAHPALTRGTFRWLELRAVQGPKPLAFLRELDGDEVAMLWNPGHEPARCQAAWGGWEEQTVTLMPMGYKIFANGQEVLL